MYSYSGCGFLGGCSPGKFWGIFSEDSNITGIFNDFHVSSQDFHLQSPYPAVGDTI